MAVRLNNTDKAINLELLDDSQRAAVTAPEDNVVIKAPAGSGKTFSLINAIADYRYNNINDRICAITYTRAARAEMEARLQQMGVYDVDVTTIHVWARTILQDLALKYDFKISILQEAEIKSILEDIVNNYLRFATKVRSVNINILYSYITGNKNMDITDAFKKTLNALENRYIQYKRDNLLYDFTDYPLYLYDVLNTYDEYIYNIDALFVDEFQDVDEYQLAAFDRTLAKKKCFIGDPWQSIFVFRGADGEVFHKLDGFTKYKLKYNYRSYQEIIDYASTVYQRLYEPVVEREGEGYITQTVYKKPSDIICDKGYGGKVTVVDPYGRCYEHGGDGTTVGLSSRGLRTILNEMLAKSPMILCRTNKQVKAIQDNTIYSAETIHQAKGLEYDDVIVIDTTIKSEEDLNIAYVALTRARNSVLVINWLQFEQIVLGIQPVKKTNYGGWGRQ